jgi:carbon-monoxide dehydrogenase large subunit
VSILGTRVVRVEDPKFLTRGATYTEDVTDPLLTGAVHATFVRSYVAHARIVAIDTSAATAMPGVVAVFTADDLTDVPVQKPPFPGLPESTAQPMLAQGVVRYVGEAVAVVLTEDRYDGEDAAELVAVEYEPLPPVIDPRRAAADETILHPDFGTNVALSSGAEPAADLFTDCEVVVTQEILNQRLAAAPLEVRSGAAVWHEDRLVLWNSNQGAQGARKAIAGRLGLPVEQVRIITPDVGGGFGAKGGGDPEYGVISWAARRTGRPVRWVESRSENMVGMTHGRAQVQTFTIGGRRDGTVLAYHLDVIQDCGAYPAIGAVLPMLTGLMAQGVYAIPKVTSRTRSVTTNTTPIGAYRGAGRPEATAAIERAMDMFAAEIGLDPAEVRILNVLPPFREPYTTVTGATYDNGEYGAAIELALRSAGYKRLRVEQAQRRAAGDVVQLGIGVSIYVEITGLGAEAGGPREHAEIEVFPDGTATILTGTSPHGQGHQTVWAMLASEQLGIPIDRITVKWGDTDLVPEGGGTAGSRSLQQGGAAVRLAAVDLIELARTRAAAKLEVDPQDLVVDLANAGLAVAGDPGTGVTFAELAVDERLFVKATFVAPGATYPFGAHVAVVEVDTESGKATLTRMVAVDDAGTIMNPLLAEGQRHGGLAQGIAQALFEEVLYDELGNPLTSTLATYPIVSASELPSFELVDMATPTSYNPLGAKGIGESGSVGSTPAVQSAVVDAVAHLGVRHIDLPTTPERIWNAITAAKETHARAHDGQ